MSNFWSLFEASLQSFSGMICCLMPFMLSLLSMVCIMASQLFTYITGLPVLFIFG